MWTLFPFLMLSVLVPCAPAPLPLPLTRNARETSSRVEDSMLAPHCILKCSPVVPAQDYAHRLSRLISSIADSQHSPICIEAQHDLATPNTSVAAILTHFDCKIGPTTGQRLLNLANSQHRLDRCFVQ